MANEFKHKDPGTEITQAEYISASGDGHIFACQATGDILYASSTTVLKNLEKGAANTVLNMGGSCIPAWTASPSLTDLTIGGGCITLSAATDIDLVDNNACAVSFDASGKTGIIVVDTRNCAEGVTMSGSLGVTGVLTATGGIELSHACQNTLTGSGGVLSIQGNRIFHAGGTDIPVADGGTGASTFTDGGILLGSGTSAITAMSVLAAGAIVKGDGSGDPVALSRGSANQILTTKCCDISWQDAVTGAVTREGGNTSENTTISTSEADLLSAASLTIAAAQPFMAIAVVRKTASTSGASSRAELHLKHNSTSANGTNVFSTTSQAEAQTVKWEYGARVTNYTGHGYQFATDTAPNSAGDYAINSAALPTAEVTSVTLRGRSISDTVTYGQDELHVYSLAAS